jgi:hypothetical protein
VAAALQATLFHLLAVLVVIVLLLLEVLALLERAVAVLDY